MRAQCIVRALCSRVPHASSPCPSLSRRAAWLYSFAGYVVQALPPADAAAADGMVREVPLAVVVPDGVARGAVFEVVSPHGGAALSVVATVDAGCEMTITVGAPNMSRSMRTAVAYSSAIDLGGWIPGIAIRQQSGDRALTVARLRKMVQERPPVGGWAAPQPKGALDEQPT